MYVRAVPHVYLVLSVFIVCIAPRQKIKQNKYTHISEIQVTAVATNEQQTVGRRNKPK